MAYFIAPMQPLSVTIDCKKYEQEQRKFDFSHSNALWL